MPMDGIEGRKPFKSTLFLFRQSFASFLLWPRETGTNFQYPLSLGHAYMYLVHSRLFFFRGLKVCICSSFIRNLISSSNEMACEAILLKLQIHRSHFCL